jgi:hypothetical protein
MRSLLEDKQTLIDVMKQEMELCKRQKDMAEGQESKLMEELGRIR